MESWEHSPSALQRRIFWYYQARLRWTGKTSPSNTDHLLASIESRIDSEEPEVQWAMNFTAAQIGIHQPEHRSRCIAIGEQTGLYKDEVVAKGCTPNYLPDFISIEVAKLKK
jgi:3-methyladenine DNA glycosylase AlkD